jgi:chemotaxis response regulator CheB
VNSSALATETFIEFKPDVLMLDMIMPERMVSTYSTRFC